MAQFHVYRLGQGRLVVDLQTDFIETGSRVVAPLTPVGTGPRPLGRLEPVVMLGGAAHVIRTGEMAAVPSGLLRDEVADMSERGDLIKAALGMVFYGF